jgi:hypothetical protein
MAPEQTADAYTGCPARDAPQHGPTEVVLGERADGQPGRKTRDHRYRHTDDRLFTGIQWVSRPSPGREERYGQP